MTASWTEVGFGELASVTRGASPRPIASERWFDSESDVRWVRISDVNRSDGRTLRDTTQALSPDGIARSRYLKPGTLIMSIAATVGVPVITGVPACIHDGFVAIQNLKADQRFLLYLLKAHESKLREAGQSGSQMNINSDIVRDLKVWIPERRIEQEAVAAALWDADDAIDSIERLIAKKRDVKQGMMQELLTGRGRLPGSSGEWREVRLGEVATVVMGQSPPGHTYNGAGDGTPLIQGNADINGRSTFDRVWTTSPTKTIEAGGVVLTVRAPVGFTGRAHADVCLGRGVCGISTSESNDFVFHALVGVEPKWRLLEQGSTFTAVNGEQVRSLVLTWPLDGEERSKIAEVLTDCDAEIEAMERRLESAREVKTGMMQELLTGRTRLPVKEDA